MSKLFNLVDHAPAFVATIVFTALISCFARADAETIFTEEVELKPAISNAEIKAMDSMAKDFHDNRVYQRACSKTPRYPLEVLRAIHGDEKTVSEIAYNPLPKAKKVHKDFNLFASIAKMFTKRQATETITIRY